MASPLRSSRTTNGQSRAIPTASSVVLREAQSAALGGEPTQNAATEGCRSQRVTKRSAWGNGSGLSRTPFTALKMAVTAPILSASVVTEAIVNVGLRLSARRT